jgi:uncharacterized protein with HEPN domain
LSRKPEERIEDMRRCCEKILEYTSGMSRDQFRDDELVGDAVMRNIEIIGEATKHLPKAIQARMPVIAWAEIAGMRDVLSHAYFRIDPDVVWNVVENKIPELLRTLESFKDQHPS